MQERGVLENRGSKVVFLGLRFVEIPIGPAEVIARAFGIGSRSLPAGCDSSAFCQSCRRRAEAAIVQRVFKRLTVAGDQARGLVEGGQDEQLSPGDRTRTKHDFQVAVAVAVAIAGGMDRSANPLHRASGRQPADRFQKDFSISSRSLHPSRNLPSS